jgi:H+-transporting ATPase
MDNHADYSSNSSSNPPNHLNTNIESGHFNEKAAHRDRSPQKPSITDGVDDDDEDIQDMDALIDELESEDGHVGEEEEDEQVVGTTGGRIVPEDLLQTDTRIGLTDAEVHQRRKKWGWNQMKEEKENLILKFCMYFVGPIQFVMEVCARLPKALSPHTTSPFSNYSSFHTRIILRTASRISSMACYNTRMKRKYPGYDY